MPNCSESHRYHRAPRCAVCDGGFGLIRYYSWRTPLRSRKCIDRLRARQASDAIGCLGSRPPYSRCQRTAQGCHDV